MKLSICLPALLLLAATSTVSAQSTTRGANIVDSIPALPGSGSGVTGPTITGSPSIINTPAAAQGYVGDLAPSAIDSFAGSTLSDGSLSGSPVGVSESSAAGGDVVDLGVISEAQEGSIGAMAGGAGGAGCRERTYGRPDLFYNYYTQGNCNRANAQMYMSPHPVPPNVGHTFFTYQPFYPEEYLYWHKNRYHNYYDNGRGLNRTRAVYYSPPIKQAVSNIYWNKLRLPR